MPRMAYYVEPALVHSGETHVSVHHRDGTELV